MRAILGLVIGLISLPWAIGDTPNVVIVYCDDLGYSDLGCFGAKGWKTPHIDSIARDGVKFTSFYVSQPVCSASRSSLLTGCYANRIGIHGALGPNSRTGIADTEVTLGEMCRSQGYATGIVGKWHLGHHPQFLPTRHGFDRFFGLPYSNDMWPAHPTSKEFPALPLFENETIVNKNVTAGDQTQLTKQYTEQAVKFIGEQAGKKPFFLYLAHSMPHVPIFASEKFQKSSDQGAYGDVIQEIDWSVGELLAALDRGGVTKNTLVIFTSDNGPWLSYGNHAGTKGPLREGKGSVWEGGVRVPFIAKWPGKIPEGSTRNEPAMTIDMLPTIAHLVGAKLPEHPIDGKNIWPLLTSTPGARSPQDAYYFYYGVNELQAVRSGPWKLIFPHSCRMIEDRTPGKDGLPAGYKQVKLNQMLFNLESDLGETTDLSGKHPEVVKNLQLFADRAREELGDSLTMKKGRDTREPGRLPAEKK
jgi:arylsulfatase A